MAHDAIIVFFRTDDEKVRETVVVVFVLATFTASLE